MSRTRRTTLLLATLAALVAGSPPALAHHSVAAIYDRSKLIEVQGVVAAFDLQNPHSLLEIVAPGADGRPIRWRLETGGVQQLGRAGFERASAPAGAKVTVKGSPAWQGEHRLWLESLVTAEGRLYEFYYRPDP